MICKFHENILVLLHIAELKFERHNKSWVDFCLIENVPN